MLLARARIKQAVREWFVQQGFIEVETASLQVSPGNETHIHAFKTEQIEPDAQRHTLYLHTSPEFACKKLLAAGEKKIFTFAQVYRNRERGPLHHPEFTMLEWYDVGAPYDRLMDHCTEIARIAGEQTDCRNWCYDDRASDITREPIRISVADAFQAHAGIELLSTLTPQATDRNALACQAQSQGIRIALDDTWSDIFSRVLVEKIEPHLGDGQLTFLDAYPISEAALARPSGKDDRLAERFEMYACGVELANGFGELTDSGMQAARFASEMDEKQRIYGELYPIDDDFIAALVDMPPASGCALGFDRLVMLATGAQRIDQVIWTPHPSH
ncbi:MAG: EF-P lysine aminoacylase EpmA [Hyphomicrobiaceae bacterium]